MVQTIPFGGGITLYRIANASGAYAEVMDYGAIWHSAVMPDRNGTLTDVLLGVRDAQALKGFNFAGMTIGRCANRVAYGKFAIDGKTFQLDTPRGPHTLHSAGGNYGQKMFTLVERTEDSITLHYHDDGRAGFVSTAEAYVTFRLSEDNEFSLTYRITPDGDTIVNPTNHAYFNLRGSGEVLDTVLTLGVSAFTPKGATGMPEGAVRSVEGTPFDFRRGAAIRQNLSSDPEGLLTGDPAHPQFDDNLILDGSGYRKIGSAYDPESGRRMEVFTDQPAMQLYTPYAKEPVPGKRGGDSGLCAFCMETQDYPNAINCPNYPSPICRAGETFTSRTAYRFSAE